MAGYTVGLGEPERRAGRSWASRFAPDDSYAVKKQNVLDRLTSFFDIPGPIAGLGAVPDSAGQEWFVCADSEFSVADIPPYSYPGE